MAYDAAVVTAAVIEPRVHSHGLDRTLVRGVTWTGGVKLLTVLLGWTSTVIVAQILSPADYGLVTMATVFIGLTTMITDFGLGSAIVALRDLNVELASQLHAAAALFGVAAFAVSCIAAVPLSRFFGTSSLVPVIIVLSTVLVLDSLRIVRTSILARDLRFKYLSLLEALKSLTAVGFTLALVFAGSGYWALVLGNVFASLVATLFVMIRLPQQFGRPRWRTLKSTLMFSSHFFVGSLAWYGYSNSDFVVAGRVLGRRALGEYTLAWTLISAPADKIMSVFGRVMPTMFAAVQRDVAALRRYFLLFTEVLGILMIPASAGLALVARDFILLIFGTKWAPAVVPLQLLCFFSSVNVLGNVPLPVLQVTGQASFPARWGLVMLGILPPAFYLSGREWGTVGIAAIWLGIFPVLLIPVFTRVFRTLDMTAGDYLACLGPTLMSVAVMAIAVLTIRALMPAAWAPAWRLAMQVINGAAAFILSAFLIQRRRLGVLADFTRSIRNTS